MVLGLIFFRFHQIQFLTFHHFYPKLKYHRVEMTRYMMIFSNSKLENGDHDEIYKKLMDD